MAGTLVAVFHNHDDAEAAAGKVLEAGALFNDISLVSHGDGGAAGNPDIDQNHPDDDHEESLSHAFREVTEHDVEEPYSSRAELGPRAVTGIVTGAPLGTILAASSLMIPGLGPIIAAGPLVAMLMGGVVGGVAGGLIGAMMTGGIPEDAAQHYHDRVGQGDTLLTILTGKHDLEKLKHVLEDNGGEDINFYGRLIDSIQSIES